MKKLLMTHAQKMKLCAKFNITQATCSEVLNFKRPKCIKHAEIRHYAITHLDAKVFIEQ